MVHVLLANVEPSSEVAKQFHAETTTFVALQLSGLVGSIITLVAASFSSVPRQATWYNFLISWIVYCASYLLLFFAGHAYDEDPGISLCIAQSTFTRSAPSFVAACSLALVIQLYLNTQGMLAGKAVRRMHYWRIMLITTPYMIFVVLIIESLSLTLTRPEATFTSISYCSESDFHLPSSINAALVITFVVASLILNLLLCLSFRKHWLFLRGSIYRSLFIRMSAFTISSLVGAIAGLLYFYLKFIDANNSEEGLVQLDIILAILPVVAIIIFGTHKDLLNVYLFWRKDGPQLSSAKTEKPLPPIPRHHINSIE
ncbi:hypothetical protein F5051DRAFT_419054 [Lentinula edodes]|nr:hypothetical protein F5051DRAFT_419054 [Lentinula edodes]